MDTITIFDDAQEVVDRFTLAAFWDEVERRTGMGDLLTADEAAELDDISERDPNYVMFQLSPDKYCVLPAEQREDWVGE